MEISQHQLNELIALSRKDLKTNCPSFASKALVHLYESLDKALQDKAKLAHELDITQTRLAKIVKSSDELINLVNEHLKGN